MNHISGGAGRGGGGEINEGGTPKHAKEEHADDGHT